VAAGGQEVAICQARVDDAGYRTSVATTGVVSASRDSEWQEPVSRSGRVSKTVPKAGKKRASGRDVVRQPTSADRGPDVWCRAKAGDVIVAVRHKGVADGKKSNLSRCP